MSSFKSNLKTHFYQDAFSPSPFSFSFYVRYLTSYFLVYCMHNFILKFYFCLFVVVQYFVLCLKSTSWIKLLLISVMYVYVHSMFAELFHKKRKPRLVLKSITWDEKIRFYFQLFQLHSQQRLRSDQRLRGLVTRCRTTDRSVSQWGWKENISFTVCPSFYFNLWHKHRWVEMEMYTVCSCYQVLIIEFKKNLRPRGGWG